MHLIDLIQMRAALFLVVACSSPQERAGPTPGLGPAELVPGAALAPRECDDAPLVDLMKLEPGSVEGSRVAVDLIPVSQKICTEMLCRAPDNEGVCCNHCGGGYVASVDGTDVKLVGLTGCGGMDCNFHCEPFGREPKTTYRFVGRWEVTRIDVEKFCRIAKR